MKTWPQPLKIGTSFLEAKQNIRKNTAPNAVFLNFSALLLLVLGILANDHNAALALNDFALLTNGLDGRTNLHVLNLLD